MPKVEKIQQTDYREKSARNVTRVSVETYTFKEKEKFSQSIIPIFMHVQYGT